MKRFVSSAAIAGSCPEQEKKGRRSKEGAKGEPPALAVTRDYKEEGGLRCYGIWNVP